MKIIKWLLRIALIFAGVALLAFFVWLGFEIADLLGAIK